MKKIFFMFSLSLLFISCSDTYDINEKNETNLNSRLAVSDFKVTDSILSFDSKDDLKKCMNALNEMSPSELREYFKPAYDEGFSPLYLNFDESLDESLMEKFATLKRERLKRLEINSPDYYNANQLNSFDDDLISDDLFASLLTNNREIIVEDKLYRYTYKGLYRADLSEKLTLHKYFDNTNNDVIVPTTPPYTSPGFQPVTPEIQIGVPSPGEIAVPCDQYVYTQQDLALFAAQSNMTDLEMSMIPCDPPPFTYGGSSNNNPSDPWINGSNGSAYKVSQQVDYMENLEPCETINGFLNSFFGVFGQVKKCHSYFDDNRRTKTKYWKENYLIYNSIGVKVKHQKFKNIIFGAGYWYASKADEIALSISQASFKFTMPATFPQNYTAPKLYYFEDKVFNSQEQLIAHANNYTTPPFPSMPFNSELIITEWINYQTGTELSHDDVREMFYSGVWQGAKSLIQTLKNREPKNITYVLYTPTVIYVNYVDFEKRNLNDEQITHLMDYNFGIGFKFNAYIDGNGSISTNWGNFLNDPLGFISIPRLYDYESVKMDFVGASRMGNTWKGSRIVYTD